MILACDFDEVIHDKSHPLEGRRMGAPIDGAKRCLEEFRKEGHEVIVFTVMATSEHGTKAVEDWMKYYEIPYDSVTSIKPNADVFIDDKAIRFIDWDKTLKEMRKYEVA